MAEVMNKAMFTWRFCNGWAIVSKEGEDVLRVKPNNADWVVKRLNEGESVATMSYIYSV